MAKAKPDFAQTALSVALRATGIDSFKDARKPPSGTGFAMNSAPKKRKRAKRK